ncbi:MAG: CvpA family protein [Lachnospiraceae bacterium]|nr:CvpA family protein [Lachnospiraceae bacterium]
MSWLCITVLIFWLLIALNGFRRGLIRTAISMVFLILVFALTAAISPTVNTVLSKHTNLHDKVAKQCTEALQDKWSQDGDNTEGVKGLIENLPLPESVQGMLEDNSGLLGAVLSTDVASTYVADYIAAWIVYGIAILISLVVSIILIVIATHFLNLIAKLPVLGGINRVGGLLLGTVQGLILIWIFFLIVTALANTAFGASAMQEINRDNILTYLYDNNLIMQFVMSMIKSAVA